MENNKNALGFWVGIDNEILRIHQEAIESVAANLKECEYLNGKLMISFYFCLIFKYFLSTEISRLNI